MANKSIKELPKATQIQEDDALPMQQGATTKQVTGLTLTLWLLAMADGHGGVKDFEKLSESGLEKTYRFLMADQTTYSFTVTDGNGIADFQHSVSGLVHTYKLIMDNGQEYTMTIKDGEKGDKGDNAYFWYKFASEKPTSSSSSMGDEPDTWMGVHSGHEATAPTDPMEYTWVRVLGNTGPPGAPATLIRSTVEYQVSTSATVEPSGNWSESIPAVPQGNYLWSRTTIQFNTGGIIQILNKSRDGLDGLGSVVSVNNISPGGNGNVELTADDVGAVPKSGGTMEGPIHMNGKTIDGLNNPTDETEAARKGYVDDAVNNAKETGLAAIKAAAPTNLLVNPDFTNPVNQKRKKTYTGPNYAIDRWALTNSYSQLDIVDGGVKISCLSGGTAAYPRQHVDGKLLHGKTLTAALCLADDRIIICSGTAPSSKVSVDTTFATVTFDNFRLGLSATTTDTCVFQITIPVGESLTVKWAALYEGSYTEETLPEFHPRRYVDELSECRRHFVRWDAFEKVGIVAVNTATYGIGFVFMPEMRVKPTISFENMTINSDSVQVTGIILSSMSPNMIELMVNKTGDIEMGACYTLRPASRGYCEFSANYPL